MELLLAEVKEAPCLVISFDESFNEELKRSRWTSLLDISKMVKLKVDTFPLISRTHNSRTLKKDI